MLPIDVKEAAEYVRDHSGFWENPTREPDYEFIAHAETLAAFVLGQETEARIECRVKSLPEPLPTRPDDV